MQEVEEDVPMPSPTIKKQQSQSLVSSPANDKFHLGRSLIPKGQGQKVQFLKEKVASHYKKELQKQIVS